MVWRHHPMTTDIIFYWSILVGLCLKHNRWEFVALIVAFIWERVEESACITIETSLTFGVNISLWTLGQVRPKTFKEGVVTSSLGIQHWGDVPWLVDVYQPGGLLAVWLVLSAKQQSDAAVLFGTTYGVKIHPDCWCWVILVKTWLKYPIPQQSFARNILKQSQIIIIDLLVSLLTQTNHL